MKHPTNLRTHSMLLACCLAAAFPGAYAEETTTSTDTTTASTSTTSTATTTSVGTSATTEAKLVAEFADFLGGEEQAGAVVSGLRQGTAFSLDAESETTTDTTTDTTSSTTDTTSTSTTTAETTTTDTTTTTDAATTIDPPTGTMGYGNVRITLRMAQSLLSQQGITQPTTEELSAVLLGGDLNGTEIEGILSMRADGMGWGQIAKEYGMTVGQLMGNGAGLTKQATATTGTTQAKTTGKAATTSGTTAKSGTSQTRSNGYIANSSKSASSAHARSNGYIPSSGGKANGAGIVSATGGSMGSGNGNGVGKGLAHKGTTGTTSTHQASAAGVSNAGGSNAMAPGQLKKN